MLGFLDIPKINMNPALEKLESGVSRLKSGTEKADALLAANKLEKRHWDQVAKTEADFQKALNRVDRIFPESKRGMGKSFEKQMGLLALLAALGLIASTAFLHVWVNR